MQSDLNKILIESMLKKAVRDIQSSPGRTVRNLIDLGVNFSKGRFQKRFLSVVQEMLQNPESAYYTLFTDMAQNVDMDLLIQFGMNLGYNSCTKGAKIIRQIEAEKNFNVPWSLTLEIDSEKLDTDQESYASILQQGVSLGIYTYFLFLPSGDAEKLIPFFEEQPDCAFVVFLKGHQITETFMDHAKKSKNLMIAVYKNEEMPDVCAKLRENKMLFAIYQRYLENDAEDVISEHWISEVQEYHPQMALLAAHPSCSDMTRKKVYEHVLAVRESQKQCVLFIDLVGDAWQIDQIISEDAFVVGFDSDGNMSAYDGMRKEAGYNIFQSTLEDVLQNAIKK
ncbi:MAG: hypothetical protein PHS74_12285 [Lachnospiraceae bacterium]|nr:hypothetical protein [Lachnospiraceae bacterium]